ncbi:MAG: helix-turn-helix domain-containing protein [Armatimonadetes bacterium]|nr:helix-turn-helix domain-containing protein [Armatimonadota bacterium]
MGSGFNLDAFIDTVAERIATRVRAEIANSSSDPSVKPRLLSVKQAAVYLSRTEQAVAHMVSAGKLPAVRGDRRVSIDVRDLDKWIESNKQGGEEFFVR